VFIQFLSFLLRYLFSRDIADVFSPTDAEALQNVFRTFGLDFEQFRPFFNDPPPSQGSPDEDHVVSFKIYYCRYIRQWLIVQL